jgi:predicted CoA-binding protein
MDPPVDELRRLYEISTTIAVVGCSSHWPKPSCVVPAYLQSESYRIIPVNPHEDRVLGEDCLASLDELTEPVDIVNVFRPADEAPAIAEDAVAVRAKCLWLQSGIVSSQARLFAEASGLAYVEDRCIGTTHGELGLGPGVKAWKEAEIRRRGLT